jgi:acetate kinase
MKILALNSGSSTIKYALLDSQHTDTHIKKGAIERRGQDDRSAIAALLQEQDLDAVEAVGHRVVHGGEYFRGPVVISQCAKFAPLHCQPNVTGIEVLQELLPDVPQVAVFDTAEHANIPAKAFLYGLPLSYYEQHHIRRYGFHGINHGYVAQEAARRLKQPLSTLKIVTCHLGNGCSISAFEKGKSVDNSMGLTPLEGLLMGTRCGDMDPSVVIYLIEELGMTPAQITELLNKKSGLLGLCGTADMRDISATANNGDKSAQTAIEVFVYRIQKTIGGAIAALNGIDAIVFTGGIGENSAYLRNLIAKNFMYMDVRVDSEKNESQAPIFSTHQSKVALLTIPANEEKVIAEQTAQLLKSIIKKRPITPPTVGSTIPPKSTE